MFCFHTETSKFVRLGGRSGVSGNSAGAPCAIMRPDAGKFNTDLTFLPCGSPVGLLACNAEGRRLRWAAEGYFLTVGASLTEMTALCRRRVWSKTRSVPLAAVVCPSSRPPVHLVARNSWPPQRNLRGICSHVKLADLDDHDRSVAMRLHCDIWKKLPEVVVQKSPCDKDEETDRNELE